MSLPFLNSGPSRASSTHSTGKTATAQARMALDAYTNIGLAEAKGSLFRLKPNVAFLAEAMGDQSNLIPIAAVVL